jgi:hypothetical protein
MQVTNAETQGALDTLVTDWIQRFENTHFRCISKFHIDTDSYDQYLTVYDPVTDQCLIVWLSPAMFGNEILEKARSVLKSSISPR